VILVISYPEDPHAERVVRLLREAGETVVLLDVSDLPDQASLTIDYADPNRPRADYRHGRDAPVDLTRASRVWWRRPQAATLSSVLDPNARNFTANEWHEAVNGLWQLLEGSWMNPPASDEVASRKALQLREASRLGLRVPRTLITSDPDRARDFIDTYGLRKTVFKTFSATHAIWRETRLVRQEDLEWLHAVRLAPVIFQEYIAADVDLRVTLVGEQLFPAAIHSQDTDYPIDFRMSLGQAHTEAAEIPPTVKEPLRALMSRLGLVYGAIDMRRTPEGDYVFLEINTAGEYLFIEDRTGQPISKAVAEWLAGAESSTRPVGR